MPHYKDSKSNLYFIVSDLNEAALPADCVKISDAAANKLRLEQATKPTYGQLRKQEYPPITDYLDAIVKGDDAAVKAYTKACLAVKAKYPKGGLNDDQR